MDRSREPRRILHAVGAGALSLAALLLAPPAAAQQGGGADTTGAALPPAGEVVSGPSQLQLVDRVVAVVWDTSVLLSEVRQEAMRIQQQSGRPPPRDPDAQESLMRAALDTLVQQTMLLEEAKSMGVQVPQDRVQQLADDRFAQIRDRFGSVEEMRRAVEGQGQNMFQYRQMLRTQAWASLTLSRLRQELAAQGRLPPATVSEEEIRQFFQQYAAGRRRPGSITFDRVIVPPRPDSAAADSARALAEEAAREVASGTPFEVVARRYSDDEGTRREGGDLGWIRQSDVAPSFANAAWAAPPGRPVGPIPSRFGYHVLKVENSRGSERRVRHILVRPRLDSADVEEARRLAESLADSLSSGADADRLAREHGVTGEQVSFRDLRLDELQGRLGSAYAEALSSPSPGDVVGPFRIQGPYDVPHFVILKVRDYIPTGEYRLEDVRDRIRDQLLQQKQFDRYLERLRDRMHIQLLVGES